MLTAYGEETASQTDQAFRNGTSTNCETAEAQISTGAGNNRLAHALSIEWLGQTAASLCWIASVFSYGITSAGDWLQLCAASAWLVANIASIAAAEAD